MALHYLDLLEAGRRIRSKAISPVELTRMMLKRIQTVDRKLHSYARVTAERTWAGARPSGTARD
jgi:amidase